MITNTPNQKLTKIDLAKSLGVSRSSLYYQPIIPFKDKTVKKLILAVLAKHPSYGHKRIALELKMNKKKILRIMKKFDLKPYKRRIRKPIKKEDINKKPSIFKNEIINIIPIRPNEIWAADFTYIKFQSNFIYLATIMDLFTREILGWSVSIHHDKYLVLEALDMALTNNPAPAYHHSDQGSEYDSFEYVSQLKENHIIISMSYKAHPWENGFQESFYSQFKLDLGRTDQFDILGELIETIHLQINYYNNQRIHTSLKTSPIKFRDQYLLDQTIKGLKNIDLQTLRQSV